MKKNKIAIKLFIITSIVFILFISITLVFQVMFFEKYYINKKLNNFTMGFEKLSSTINKGKFEQQTIFNRLTKFDEENNSRSVILNDTLFSDSLFNGTLKENLGYIFFPFNKDSSGAIINIIMKEWGAVSGSQYHDYIVKGGKTLIYKKNINDISYIIGVSPIVQNGSININNVIFSMVSLQPVGDAVNTIKEFYVYIYILALALILILSFLYSLMISKPLVNLSKTASKMTELDFTVKCEIKSNDEIGELASILNFLSQKLDKTLTQLKTTNEKLREDIEKERQLEIMRKEFVAGVSHELKTPITLISGYAEALKDDIVATKDKDFFVDVILDESKKMDYLIKDMLDLAQLETGNLKMSFEKFNIVELLNFVLKKFTKKMEEKNIRINTWVPDNYAIVNGDVLRIEQVLVNLISNAMRYVPIGGLIIFNIEKSEDSFILSIENEGNHIPEDEITKIWERFYKVDKSRRRDVEGTGIGLSIVKNILILHNSKFGVENTEIGVKFFFILDN